MILNGPIVFVIHNTYQVIFSTKESSFAWIRVGDKNYYDNVNGILRLENIHKISIPAKELDQEKAYTVCVRKVIDRKTYYTETANVEEMHYKFKPVAEGRVQCFHVSDTHGNIDEPVRAAKNYGEIDFLIINGDMRDDNNSFEDFQAVYSIAYQITEGHIPVIFSRGNHDLRGKLAEKMIDYFPHDESRTYYTFRMGSIWGLVLDCGEDKADYEPEYGNTTCFHEFRVQETEFLKKVISQREYEAEDIAHRIIIVHNPFTQKLGGVCDIEEELYTQWAELLKEYIKPDVMICGHLHCLEVHMPGCKEDSLGQPCPIIIGAQPGKGYFAGAGIELGEDEIRVSYSDSDGMVREGDVLTVERKWN